MEPPVLRLDLNVVEEVRLDIGVSVRIEETTPEFVPLTGHCAIKLILKRPERIKQVLFRVYDRDEQQVYQELLNEEEVTRLAVAPPAALATTSVGPFANPLKAPYRMRVWVSAGEDLTDAAEEPDEVRGQLVHDQSGGVWGKTLTSAGLRIDETAVGRNQATVTHGPVMHLEFQRLEAVAGLSTSAGFEYQHGQAYEYGAVRAELKRHWPEQHLRYSAYLELDGTRFFVLGWDHGAMLKKVGASYVLHRVYAHGQGNNADAKVYRVQDAVQTIEPTDARTIPAGMHACRGHRDEPCSWRRYDLAADQLAVDKVLTWGVTSCSVAALWNEGLETVVMSHMAFRPPIPVSWIACEEAVGGGPFQIVSSCNGSEEELEKFQLAGNHPGACSAMALVSRGPLNRRDLQHDAPFMTHPYVVLDLSDAANVLYEGVLGYNNDPELPREMPPFHACLSETYRVFQSENAPAILQAAGRLLAGYYGNPELYRNMIQKLHFHDLWYIDNHEPSRKEKWLGNEPYSSIRLSRLLRMGAEAPAGFLRGKERAVFLLAELVAGGTPENQTFQDQVIAAWDEFQLRFAFQLSQANHQHLCAGGITW